jgi:hypothetical protein
LLDTPLYPFTPLFTHPAVDVGQVKLDAGIQKYVLLRLCDARSDTSKLLVWGATAAAYHNHILQVGG